MAAASYEARTFGVRSAMPMFRARHLCPELVVVDLRMEHYRAVSQQIRAILETHTELIEPLALDEFYLDVSATAASIAEAGALARHMKDEIRRGTGLTASAGVAPSKFVAKIASDLRKPDGLVIVEPDAVVAFLAPLPVSRMWGVGQVTERRLKELGIAHAGRHRGDRSRAAGRPAGQARAAHGRVRPGRRSARGAGVAAAQVGEQRDDVRGGHVRPGQLAEHITRLAQRVSERLQRRGLAGRTVVLKLTYRNFQHITRRTTLTAPTGDADVIAAAARALLDRSAAASRLVRLVGVGVSGLAQRRRRRAAIAAGRADPQGGDETPGRHRPAISRSATRSSARAARGVSGYDDDGMSCVMKMTMSSSAGSTQNAVLAAPPHA